MAFGGDDVDTLALMFDKLQYIFRGYDSYIETFTQMQGLYKEGKLSEREYYHTMTDAVLKYSALEFLGLKAMFEIKKALNRMNNPSSVRSSTLAMMSGSQNSIESFISAKTLPGRNDFAQKISANEKTCTSCGKTVSSTAKFCTSCGNKT
jgi:hypothetical protein